jgi:hypothetical protein
MWKLPLSSPGPRQSSGKSKSGALGKRHGNRRSDAGQNHRRDFHDGTGRRGLKLLQRPKKADALTHSLETCVNGKTLRVICDKIEINVPMEDSFFKLPGRETSPKTKQL